MKPMLCGSLLHYSARLRWRALALVLAPWLAPMLQGASVKVGDHTFTTPDGFVVERAAEPGMVPRPVSASFDDRGRLYITDSSGSNLPPAEQLKNPTHRVLRLEDTDGDGRFDKSVVFADKVMFPQGCLWHGGSVYVAGPPSIWKFTDSDGDGVADKREEWFKGGTLTGCANDIHGPHLGPDGYLYWTKGAFAEQTHTLWNGRKLNDKAAHILRARPDGTGLDVVMTGGMDNPVEVAFTVEGEVVFTSTFIDFSQPGRRDGIGHAAYGAVFGKENDALEDGRVKRTGPGLSQPFIQLGAGAPSGLCRYLSAGFGEEYRDNLFATTFNLHKITRHRLTVAGASYTSDDSDFVVSDNLDFHPTDVLEDADGSLLIVDTGGWYKLCCPSSQLAKADVLGGLYRVRKTSGPPVAGSQRIAGYRLLTEPPPRDRLPGIGLKEAALQAESKLIPVFRRMLEHHIETVSFRADSALHVRNAAEALGRLADKDSAADLFAAIAAVGDRDEVLFRSLAFALIEIGNTALARKTLAAGNAAPVRRAAMVVLDQVSGGELTADEVLPHLASSDAGLRRTASWIVKRRPGWGDALAGNFRARLAEGSLKDGDRAELQSQLVQFARQGAVQTLLGATAGDSQAGSAARLTALRAMTESGVKEMPATWLLALIAGLNGADAAVREQCAVTARALPSPKNSPADYRQALERLGRDAAAAPETRLSALAAVPGGADVDAPLFAFLLSSIAPAQSVAARSVAAAVLARSKLSDAQLEVLADRLKEVGPLELPRILPAFDRSPTEAMGMRLLAGLRSSRSASSLRPEVLRPRLTNFPTVVRARGEEFLASVNADAAKQAAHLEALLSAVRGKGDVRRGQAIFNSAKAACSACHAIGYLGGKVGPDLTRISEVRSERDLLEAIVYPSASFVRSYEPVFVATRDGEEYSGVLRRDAADEVVLATGPGAETKLARAEITEMRPGTVSTMPQGLDEQLSREELADLLAFLKSTRWGPR